MKLYGDFDAKFRIHKCFVVSMGNRTIHLLMDEPSVLFGPKVYTRRGGLAFGPFDFVV